MKSPGFERFFQSTSLEATFGGGEANVVASLAILGLESAFVTALPENPIAEACLQFLRGKGVDTSFISRQGVRIGIYFLEAGANQRPSNVVCDRAISVISTVNPGDFDSDAIFDGAFWDHTWLPILPRNCTRQEEKMATCIPVHEGDEIRERTVEGTLYPREHMSQLSLSIQPACGSRL